MRLAGQHVGVVPTLLDFANLPVLENVEEKSLSQFFRGKRASLPREAVYAMMHTQEQWVESRCVRTRQHKLIRNFLLSRAPGVPIQLGRSSTREGPVLELYGLAGNLHELKS